MPHHRRVKPHISSTVIPQITTEPSQRYIQYKIKQWLCRAFMAKAQVDSSFFECLAYAQNGLDGIVKALRGVLGENSTCKVLSAHKRQELGRECVIKKASDLLSMYVGEAEKNIAAAFAEAEANGYILVIDEADSFMYSRESATHSWEVTQVNEFLTQLEAFKGICICTSNRRTSMDAAAMRRFSFKIPFAYAKAVQLERLYTSILAPLCDSPWTEKERQLLFTCKHLAPGDFAAVRSQFWLDDVTTHKTLIEALVREQKAKLDTQTKVVGF